MNLTRARKAGALAIVGALALGMSACSGGGKPKAEATGGSGGGGGNSGYTFAMITHETPGDTFWDRIKAGANQAAKDTGSTLKYSADPDATKQAVLIQNAIDSKVDGIATTLVTPDALIPTVKKAVAAGIPVVSFNSGLGFYKQAGALTHFSSDEFLAGQQAGEKVQAAGGKKVLCVIQQAGSVALEDRCEGVKDKFPNTENIQVNGADDSAVISSLQAKLSQDKSIDWVVTLGAAQALDTIKAIAAAGSKAKLGTFDLNVDAAQAIQDGKIQFSIDQQPYVQGYLAITQLYLNKKNGNDHRRRRPGADRSVVRRQDQHRRHPAVHQEQHPLVRTSRRGGRRLRAGHPSRISQRSKSMSQTTKAPPPSAPAEASNRVTLGLSNRLLARPEVGALVAAIVIFIFFLIVAPAFRSADSFFTVLYQSSTIGIVAVGVGMLMIGGEFDLSAGVIVTAAGLVNAMFCYELGINLLVGAALSLVFCLVVGFLNGYLVMRTGIPSFLITLGTFFILQGANLGVTKLVTGSVSSPNINQMDGYSFLNASSLTISTSVRRHA